MSAIGKHIVLIGFMGSGKSTIGKLLSDRLDMHFLDQDQEIERSEQMPISEIFKTKGEKHFRRVENKILVSKLTSNTPLVISTGGGAPCFHNGMKEIKQHSISIYLKVGRKTLADRIFQDKTRPLVKGKTKNDLLKFIDVTLRDREKFYLQADIIILAYDQPHEIVERIIRHLKKLN